MMMQQMTWNVARGSVVACSDSSKQPLAKCCGDRTLILADLPDAADAGAAVVDAARERLGMSRYRIQ
ncbi:MAG: hypothetical protein Q8L65_06835 [Burkholderiales bacterium]|nr:hypothetical protein [Burkholderiales bacterium]